MKVLMISDVYPPLIGGMERELQLLSEGLSKRGHQVVICTLQHSSTPSLSEENGIKVYRFKGIFQKFPYIYHNSERKFHPPLTDCVIVKELKELIKREKPEIIHAHGWILYSVLSLKCKYKTPLVATFHDYGFICPVRWSSVYSGGICNGPIRFSQCLNCEKKVYGPGVYGFAKSFLAYWGVRSNRVFACDVLVYTNPNIVEKMGYLKFKKIYLEHPIDTDEYKPLETEEYKDRILCWVKLDRIKGIDTIFKVARQLPEYQFDFPFVGDDKEYYRILKPDNVNLLPKQPSREIPNLINRYPLVMGQFTIGVFGLSELEAMSCGKPVVAYWDRKYDFLYKKPCPILSSQNVKEIINLVRSNIQNKELGKLSRDWILENHSLTKVINKLIEIYRSVLEKGSVS